MTPTHAVIAGGAIVLAGVVFLTWSLAKVAGDTDDRDGRPRG